MGFFVRRLLVALLLIAVVPSLTFMYFAATVSEQPVLPGLGSYLKAVFLHFELDGGLVGREKDVYYLLREGVPVDIALMLGGLALGVGVGSLAGLYLSERRSGPAQWALYAFGVVAMAVPAAVVSYGLFFFFGSTSGSHAVSFVSDYGDYVSPTEDFLQWLQSIWVPWLAVSLPIIGAVMRVSAGASRDALGYDSVRTARAKGLSDGRVLRRHVLPFAVAPISAYGGASVNLLILNSAIVERIFNLPGAFRYVRGAIDHPNVAVLQALALITVLYVVVGNLLADLAARIDPRVR